LISEAKVVSKKRLVKQILSEDSREKDDSRNDEGEVIQAGAGKIARATALAN
jgi:hypothetical protein